MKIAFFETTPEEQATLISLLGPEASATAVFYGEKLNLENVGQISDADIISVFVNSEVTKEVMEALPQLKFIATRSTGFDHVDIAHAKNRDLKIANVPAYGSRTVAEFTFALMLNLSRKIFTARHQMMEGGSFDISKLQGFNLQGKTLGVVGTGKIGKNVVRIAKGFEMNIIAHDVFPDPVFAKEMGFQYVPLEKLLSISDIVTIHAPLNEQTRHLINKNNITLFKRGAYLINTARGEIVETEALFQALASGQLAGAGLDVLESERQLKEDIEILARKEDHITDFKTLFQDRLLMDMPQVVLTPHIAFSSQEAHHEILRVTAENITGFMADKPQNLV